MNYAELSQAVSEWSNKDSIDKVMPTIIRFGQRDLEDNLRIRPMEYHPVAVSLAPATASLALPSDFLELIFLVLVKDGIRYPVDGREAVRVLYTEYQNVVNTGVPTRVARVADDFVFNYITDVAYDRDWAYYRRLPVLVASPAGTPAGNSNWWSEQAEEAFLMSCLNKLSLYVTGISDSDKKKWADAALATRNALIFKEARETTGGSVLRSSNWK